MTEEQSSKSSDPAASSVEPNGATDLSSIPSVGSVSKAELKERIVEQIKTVYDPEIPMNVYDLGLIYDISVDDSLVAQILMTLTAPGCPAAGILPVEVANAAKKVSGIADAKVELTFDPPWSMQMMPEFVKLELGLF